MMPSVIRKLIVLSYLLGLDYDLAVEILRLLKTLSGILLESKVL